MTRFVLVVASLAAGAVLAASDGPRRKSGLWHITITSAGMPQMSIQECVDRNTDDLTKMPGDEEISCSKIDWRREGAGFVMDSVCKVNGSTATTRSVFSGSFDSAFKMDSKSSYRPPYEGLSEVTMKMEARWTGPCKPGQKPGEVIIPGMPNMQDFKGAPKKR
jgi:hypothetical protein